MYGIGICILLALATVGSFGQPADPRDNSTPYWHADGRIYFKSNRDGRGGVYSVKDNGKDLRLLMKSAGDNYPPRWAHDRKRGVFMTSRDGGASRSTR